MIVYIGIALLAVAMVLCGIAVRLNKKEGVKNV